MEDDVPEFNEQLMDETARIIRLCEEDGDWLHVVKREFGFIPSDIEEMLLDGDGTEAVREIVLRRKTGGLVLK